jgi:hypothetical protein
MRTLAASFMDNWRKTAHRITKYNPDNRDEKGSYKVDEWTSISDIGKEFNGIRFTYDDYISIEEKYISSIREFINYFDLKEFEIKNLEWYDRGEWNKYSLHLKELFKELPNKKTILIGELEDLARLMLRECVWCDLEIGDKGIHFGYDYYMYFGTGKKLPEELKIKIQRIGLYPE